MRHVVLDTATPAMTLALFDDAVCVASSHEVIGRGHAERLVPAIATLPDGGRADRIVVGVGPGSFTGIRVGVAAARALGLAWDVPVAGLSTLALLAAGHPGDEPVLAAIEGGHGEVFAQAFGGDPLKPVGEVLRGPLADLDKLREGRPVVGPAALSAVTSALSQAQVDARHFARVAHRATLPPSPHYGRAPDAEVGR